MLQREVVGVPADRQDSTFNCMRRMKEFVRKAFESDDKYNLDWLLFIPGTATPYFMGLLVHKLAQYPA